MRKLQGRRQAELCLTCCSRSCPVALAAALRGWIASAVEGRPPASFIIIVTLTQASALLPLNHPYSSPRPSQPIATSIPYRIITPRLANNLDPTLPFRTLYSSRHSKMPGLVSATGVLAFLSEEEPELKVFALQTLNDDIDTVWTEVAGALSQMYVLS